MSRRHLTHRLACFLLKEDLPSPEAAIDGANAQRESVSCGDVVATLYYKQAHPHPPGWAKFFDGDPVHTKLQSLKVASNGAVLLVPAGGRHFALAWGTGRFMLVPGTWEENFGLRVTLNSLSADQIRSVDHTSFDAYTLQHRAQSSRAGRATDLGVDVDQSLVKALTGTPTDKTLAVKMTGVDALTVSVPTDRSALPLLLDRYLERYNSTQYQEHFPWVDHMRPVLDQVRIDSLDAQLIARLQSGDRTRLWLAVPDILEQDDVEKFTYRPGVRATAYHDTFLPDFLKTVDDVAAISVTMLKARHVYGHRSSAPQHPRSWSVYRCIYCEIDDGQDTYLLYDGKWYRVTRDFVSAINAQVERFVVPSTLPVFDLGNYSDEEGYNAAVAAAAPQFQLLDRRNVYHGGSSSQIEVCDLFALDRRFVHVKRYAGSATLSHLFNQGEVPARLLIQDVSFREKVIRKLDAEHVGLIDADGIRPSEFTIVFAIASDSDKPLARSLPFFSRLTFARVATTLRNYGYNVELMKIDVVDAPAAVASDVSAADTISAAAQPQASR